MLLSRMILPVVALTVVATACSTSTNTAETNTSASPEATCSFDRIVQGVTAIQQAGSPPELVVGKGAKPPTKLVAEDLCEGEGVAVTASDVIVADYVGVSYRTGEVVDTSYGKQPLVYPLQNLIPGWVQGVQGMKPGGARLLLIPGELAYGPNPPAGSPYQPNEALAFIVELDQVNPPTPSPT